MESPESVRVVNFAESDVARVQAELDASPERASATEASPETVRQAVVAVLPQPAPATTVAAPSVTADAAGTQQRVEALVQLAKEQGIDAAHARAAADEPYVLDAFHDALAGAFYDELKRRGTL